MRYTKNIIGHRGNKEKFLENTLLGFKSILENDSIYGLELDLNITKDKKIVINHDIYLSVLDKKFYIYDYTYDELNKIKQEYNLNKELLPLFKDFVKLIRNTNKTILIELKSLPYITELNIDIFVELVNDELKILTEETMSNIYIISFDYRILKAFKHINKNIKYGIILHKNLVPLDCLIHNKDIDIEIIVAHKYWITKEIVDYLHSNNKKIYCWTVNSYKELKVLEKIGIDCFITDYPDKFVKMDS